MCSDLYLAQYIENYEKLHQQTFVADAVVVDVKNASFDALVLNTGSIVRINKNVSINIYILIIKLYLN